MYEVCEVCGVGINRDCYFEASASEAWAVWMGVCGCHLRRWRWLSATGDGPWELARVSITD